MLDDLILANRSYRRFDEKHAVELKTLRELVNLARLSASGANLQPLKYLLSCEPETNERIFPHTRWAGYLQDWEGPAKGERPAAYVVILGDTEIKESAGCDHGIAALAMLLGATERGLGGCILGSIARNSEPVREAFKIPSNLDVLLAIALGKPNETVVVDELGPDGNTGYWRDDKGKHHVPKRALDDIIFG